MSQIHDTPSFFMMKRGSLVIHATSHNIEQFIRNGLLTTLVILQIEFSQEFIGIIRSSLHGNHTGCMLTRLTIQQSSVNHQTTSLRKPQRPALGLFGRATAATS